MKSGNRHRIRQIFAENHVDAGDLAYLHEQHFEPYTMRELRVAVGQIAATLPYKTSMKTYGPHLVVRRDEMPTESQTLPGVKTAPGAISLLLAMRPWPGDLYANEKNEYIQAVIEKIKSDQRILATHGEKS